MFGLVKNRAFQSLFWSGNFSALGDAIYILCISWYIAEVHQSGTLMGSILLCMGIVRFVFGLIGGVIVDQYGSKRIMVASDLIRAALMTVLFLLTAYEAAGAWYLFVLAILFGMIDAFYWPALGAMQQRVVEQGDYSRANSLYFTSIRMINIAGPALGGYLLAFTSFAHSFLITAVLFVLSALCLTFIQDRQTQPSDQVAHKTQAEFSNFLQNVKEGYRFVAGNQVLLVLIITMFLSNIGANGVMALMPFVAQNLQFDAEGLGFLQMSISVGAFAMGVLLSVRALKQVSLTSLCIGFLGQGVFYGVVYWFTELYAIAASLFLVGVFTAVIGVVIPTIMQTTVPPEHMGKVGGIMMTASMASTPFAHFLFGSLSDYIEPTVLFGIGGGIEVATAVGVLIYLKIAGVNQTFSPNNQQKEVV